jgi:hypothetical protein
VDLNGELGSWQETTPLPVPLHSAAAAIFRGYLYVAGGADAAHAATVGMYRARVNPDGSLGSWEALPSLPSAVSYASLVNFGPYLYVVGGETASSEPQRHTLTGAETANVWLARINLRTGALTQAGWSAVSVLVKERSKHSTLFVGGSLFVTSGLYAGGQGSSENAFAPVNSDGTLQSWAGATGAQTIAAEIGYSLYNQATITYTDGEGNGRLLVLGGGRIFSPPSAQDATPSASVVYY